MQTLLFIIGILGFISLVLIHEWGHFIAARTSGVKVDEFGLGFPPRAWAKKTKSGLLLSINWLPLGGFVKLFGEHDADKRPGSYGAASLLNKTKIMLAGVFMNLLAGIFLLTILAWVGMPVILDNQFTIKPDTKISRQEVRVGDILPGSAATKTVNVQTGQPEPLKRADQIYAISDVKTGQWQSIKTPDQLRSFTTSHQNDPVLLYISRNYQTQTLSTKLGKYLGVVPTPIQFQRSTWSAPIVAVGLTGQVLALTAQGLGHAIGGLGSAIAGLVTVNHTAREHGQTQASDQIGGPVAIVSILWSGGSLGVNFIVDVVAQISLALAFINLLPIPALDGGRLFVTYLYRLLGKKLSKTAEEMIHGVGMALLLSLMVLITIVDVKRF